MCVFTCSLVADKANRSSEMSKCKQSNSESDDSGDTLAVLSLSYCASFAHLITLNACIGIHVNYVKFEKHAWPYPLCINFC